MEKEDKYLVPKEKALDHAITHMLLGVVTKTPRLEEWRNAVVRSEPLELFDINGQLLFYEFSVEKDRKVIGRIKVSASKVLGPAVYTAEVGPRLWDADKATGKAEKMALKKHKGASIILTRLVCYSYPKLGILVVFGDPKTRKEFGRMIVDVATYEIVPPVPPAEDLEGGAIWSLYSSIPQKDRLDRISRWETDDRLVESLKKLAKRTEIDLRGKLSDAKLQKLEDILSKASSKQPFLKKGNNPDGGIQDFQAVIWPPPAKIITLILHGQEDGCWCAVATGQMLLRHHHYFYEQNDIAVAMATVPPAPATPFHTCGTFNPDQVDGYESLSHNYLDAIYDGSATWSKAQSEIDQDRPLKSGIPRHARACAGYQCLAWLIYSLENIGFSFQWRNYLYIYDPWPPNVNNGFCNAQGGAEYWEDWDTVTHTNYIYIRPCTGTMICQD